MALPIIFVDDEQHIRMAVSQTLEIAGYEVHCLERADKVLSLLVEDWPGVVITDINMPGLDGLALMQQVHQHDADLPVILITGHGDISMAVNAIRDGAYDFIEKPFPADLLLDVVKRAMEKRSLTLENRQLRQELASHATLGPRVLGKTEVMQRMRRLISQIAPSSSDVMLHGETGTGKELIARYIHESSPRHNHNFVAINCGAVAESIMESELFGHEQGAFTDAKQKRIGKFEYANGGTLFLDEIESMPMSLQIKLLRVLEEELVENANDELLSELVGYKTRLRRLRRTFNYHERLFSQWKEDVEEELGEPDRAMTRLYEAAERLQSLVSLYYDWVGDLSDGYISLASHRLNNIMKVLTVITAIFVPLSFLAGLYGMNFDNIPELHFRYGYFVLLLVMTGIAAALLWLFRKSRWI